MTSCSTCKEQENDVILCDKCNKTQCQKCTNLTASEIRAITLKKRLLIFLCDECRQKFEENKDTSQENSTCKLLEVVIAKMNDIHNEVQTQKNTIKEQGKIIEKQGIVIENLSEAVNTKNEEINCGISKVIKSQEEIVETYSDKIKKNKVEPVVVIKPKNTNQKHDETRKEVKNAVDPTKIAVSCMKNARDGGVIIECRNKSAAAALKTEATNKMSENYNISEPKRQLPKIKIVGITETNKPDEIEDLLLTQNDDILSKEKSVVKVTHVAPNRRNQRSFIAYVQTDGESYRNILKTGKVNIGWDRCAVYDAVDIPMCFNCCGFNHLAKKCDRETVCAKCSGPHHINDCKVETNEEICVNCKFAVEKLKMKHVDFRHHTWSKECPAYLRNLEIKKSKTDFL